MNFLAKKLCSIIMVLCIILSAVFVLPVSAATYFVIAVDTPVTVTLSEGESFYLQFTPEESGEYIFYARNGLTNEGHVVDSKNFPIASAYSYSGIGENFCLLYEFVAGNTYFLRTSYSDASYSGSYDVVIERNPVKSFTVEPINLIENSSGFWSTYWDSEQQKSIDFFDYYWHDKAFATIELTNGDTVSAYPWESVEYNGYHFDLSYYDDQHGNPWTVGNTYTSHISFMGTTLNIPVTISESQYKSLEILSVEPIKETDYTYIDFYGNKQYNIPNFTYKITLKDGRSVTHEYYEFCDDYKFSIFCSQSPDPWTIGGENLVTVRLDNLTTTFSVIINEVPDWEYIEQNGGIFITGSSLNSEEIVVPDTIDGKAVIGVMDLGDCLKTAKTLTLPDSITYISEGAFACEYRSRLETVNIGKNISVLSPDAFAYCDSLKAINVSVDNKNFSTVDGIVYNKSGDTLVVYPLGQGYTYNIPDNVINVDVLYNKNYYSDVKINFSENSKAFKKVDGVTYNSDMTTVISCDTEKTGSYVMPDSVTIIAPYAFSNSQLSSVTVSKNVTQISYYSFASCENLETINMPNTITSIDAFAFMSSNVKNLTKLPANLTELGSFAFSGTQLHTISIPAGVKEIGYNCFSYSSLENIALSNGLETIGDFAFSCSNVLALTIPSTVKYIGREAFSYTKIQLLSIPNNVIELGDYAFCDTPIKTLSIGSGLTEIFDGVFSGTKLTEVTLPKNIKRVGKNAFSHSPISKVIFIADEVYIGESAFYDCPLDKTTLTNNIKGFGDYAFAGNSMTSVKIPDSITDITYRSFAYSEKLADIDIPDKIEHIDGYAFAGTAWYESQKDGVVYLENALYHYKGNVPENTEIDVKDGTIVIADYAFALEQYCDGSCGNDWQCGNCVTLYDTRGLKSITLPDGLKTIGYRAFYGCCNLEKVVIPSSVNCIESDAFLRCDSLTIYGYEGSYAETYANERGIPFAAIVKKSTDDVTVKAPPEVIDPDTQLIVEAVPLEDILQKLPQEIEYTAVSSFDIYLELSGTIVQPDGTVTVELVVPSGFNGTYCKIYHVSEDGTMTDMNAVYKNGKMIFNTDHFSVYAIVENKPPYISGDVNDDGKINNKDLGLLIQYINTWSVEINIDAADVNDDTKINNKDYGILAQYINNWGVELK